MNVAEHPTAGRRLPASYFDELYAARQDPWAFESSRYERGKYVATLAALGSPERRFAHDRLEDALGDLVHAVSETEPRHRLDRWDRPA